MNADALREMLRGVADGRVPIETAVQQLAAPPIEDLGYACLDHHRTLRCGHPEVIFGQGKTPAQIATIFDRLAARGNNVLATRVPPEAAQLVRGQHPSAQYHELARTLSLQQVEPPPAHGFVGVVCAGSSDLPVAEEARVTLEVLGQPTRTMYDVGVAGLHRLLARSDDLRAANVLIVVAGMEGALPSVVGGLVQAPVIAVPTSVGYGASFHGLAALLAMLNSCAAGVSVVNIDNGFGAGYQAALINELAGRDQTTPAAQETPRE